MFRPQKREYQCSNKENTEDTADLRCEMVAKADDAVQALTTAPAMAPALILAVVAPVALFSESVWLVIDELFVVLL